VIQQKQYDVVIIGAGAAGMAAACETAQAGLRTAIIDRESYFGGILLQCIHNGFGLHHFKQELTGPEYAEEYIGRLSNLPIHSYLETTVVDIRVGNGFSSVIAYSAVHGVLEFQTRAVVLAMGCRERNRGNIGIPGTRPAGIFTAGLAQRLLNIDGHIPGKKAVIIGSGDIGLIMARRLTWVGCKVQCAVEILPYPSGLTRNIVQCLQDFDIPLFLSHTVTKIIGRNRVEAVEIAPINNGVPYTAKSITIECDTILLSVGLIPENELSRKAGVTLSPNTNGPVVDHRYQTVVPGIFACGNVLHVHDLVDYVSEEASLCGKMAVEYVRGAANADETRINVTAGPNVKYVIPNTCMPGRETRFLGRSLIVSDSTELVLRQGDAVIKKIKLKHVRPAEMLSVTLGQEEMAALKPAENLEFAIL
jgi:NADPH-dependent 2,4-dienoyl-CoA reductase/sulfur reductase-like enzyme